MKRAQFMPTGVPLAMRADAFGALFEVRDRPVELFEVVGPAAVVDIRNPLVQHEGQGWDSYDGIVERVKAAASSPTARAVVLRVDSPGGVALGMIECAREMRGICRAAGKPLLAFVDGCACSSAYALVSSADRIVTPPAGVLGSVGVYQALVDATAADRAMGLVFEFESSGDRKLDGNPHVALTDAARAEVRRHVNGLAELFFGLVGEMRPSVPAKGLRAMNGAVFLGSEAVAVGLADAIGTWSDVLALAGQAKAEAPAPAATEKETVMGEDVKPGDEKKAKARKAFFSAMEAAFDSMFGDDEPAKDDKEPKKEAKAEDAPPAKEDKPADKEEAKALSVLQAKVEALTAAAMKGQGDAAALRAELAAKEDLAARTALIAKRPDFTKEQLDVLALVPLAKVAEAVATWPRGPLAGKVPPPGVLATAPGVLGANNTNVETLAEVPKAEADYVLAKMGLAQAKGAGVTTVGRNLELGAMTPAEARASLEADKAKKAGDAGGKTVST
jgi:ClpP class serine protease